MTNQTMSDSRQKMIDAARKLAVTAYLEDGQFDKINLCLVRELFRILDVDNDGFLDTSEFCFFLQEIIHPPCPEAATEELIENIRTDCLGKVDLNYFYSSLSIGSVRRLLNDEHRLGMVKQKTLDLEKAAREKASVPREFMVERFEWRTERDEAFRTLPLVITYFLTFLALVVTHLRVWDRNRGERSQEEHMAGWGFKYIGPYLDDHLPNLDNVYIWLETSGLQFAFGYCAADADKSIPKEFCEIAPRHSLIGDIMLRKETMDGSEDRTWLLHSPTAQALLAVQPSKRYEASLLALKHLRDNDWFDRHSLSMEMAFSAYNAESRFFTVNNVIIRFDDFGFATHSEYVWAVPAETYPDHLKWTFGLDAIYLVLLILPFKDELIEVCTAIRASGFQGFLGYWAFWNVIDWFMIINGSVLVQLWIQCCLAIENDKLQGLLDSDYNLLTSTSSLDISQLEVVYDDLKQAVFLFRLLHNCMACNTVAIMCKFAKCFQANARLQIVQESMKKAIGDVLHFMLIFCTIFLGFTLVAHILFGNDFIHFNSFSASFNTVFLCLLGDFGWYSDLTERHEPLSSGLPFTVVSAWFWSFEIVAVLILMNMLLAIVMDNYALATGDLAKQPDAPPIWIQCVRYWHRKKLFKAGGWASLEDIRDSLTDPKCPAPTSDEVTVDSLKKAFPDMKPEQAEFIMDWMFSDMALANNKHPDNPHLADVQQLEVVLTVIGENLHVVQNVIHRCISRLDRLTQSEDDATAVQALPPEPAAEPGQDVFPDVTEQLESQLRVLKELCGQFSKQQQSTQNLAVALTELTKFAPNKV